jgi:hypothetical protein
MRFTQCRDSYFSRYSGFAALRTVDARVEATSPSQTQFLAAKSIFGLPFFSLLQRNSQNWVCPKNIPIKAMIFNKKLVTFA